VDHRRTNKSVTSLKTNVLRLKEYKARLVVAPVNPKKPHAGEVSKAEVEKLAQVTGVIAPAPGVGLHAESIKLADVNMAESSYKALRTARNNAKYVGKRAKRAAEKAAKTKEQAASRKR
jgi:large subunit ribosomal protein L13e